MRHIDTNVVLRYLVQPVTPVDHARHTAARALFRRIQGGQEHVRITESVIAEVLYVLCSPRQYGLGHANASARLRPILSLRGLHIPHKRTYLRALEIFSTYSHLDFEDAVVVAHMAREGEADLYTFDSDFDRIPGIVRIEP
ncbi:MAG: type II toxin-antitoxin system VapC family toxin [Chloroflexota bacterium]|nr:type II toxin-antitoxin system VapC family toxin [Chloroflexota bacterium]